VTFFILVAKEESVMSALSKGYPGGPSASGPSWGCVGGWTDEYRAEGTGFREGASSLYSGILFASNYAVSVSLILERIEAKIAGACDLVGVVVAVRRVVFACV
jgi:hypothetical protein